MQTRVMLQPEFVTVFSAGFASCGLTKPWLVFRLVVHIALTVAETVERVKTKERGHPYKRKECYRFVWKLDRTTSELGNSISTGKKMSCWKLSNVSDEVDSSI